MLALDPLRVPTVGPFFSPLTCLLQAVARAAADRSKSPSELADNDDLSAALGRPFLTCAVPGQARIGCWAHYAHDAFLLEAGRLFGLSIRPIHPPEAARGLDQAAEFAQHFEASYQPFVLRALEHGQPVLARTGPGEESAQAEAAPRPAWGLITRTCAQGIGLAGITPGPPPVGTAVGAQTLSQTQIIFERPPVQLYVVEEATPTVPPADVLLAIALKHTRLILSNRLADRFGVVTGPATFEHWAQRLHETTANAPTPSESDDATAPHALAREHAYLAASVVEGHRSGERFFERQLGSTTPDRHRLVETLAQVCRRVADTLEESTAAEAVAALLITPPGRARLTDQLNTARAATTQALTALAARCAS